MEQAYLPGTVRQRIQDQLKERKITQGELAAEIGMAESSLSRFLSEKTDKIGDEYIIKIADFLGVSTDFILGQTDFPERRNYDIGELGLSYKAAMALYTREIDTDVVNRILENPQFPAITRMIARYFKDSNAEGPAGLNAMWDTMQKQISALDTGHLKKPQEGTEAITQILGMLKTDPYERDIQMIQSALMEMLRGIKTGIQTQTPTTEPATKQTTQAMMRDMVKGSNSLISQTTLEGTLAQFATAYSSLPNATPELSEQFSELFRQFVKGLMDIIQRQGLTNGIPDE
uniref:helix-turn-helix domain-containing protein n=1 Tax=Enterocloster clostridioformis TaxID=1531 RepID=UPI001C3E4872|nr:helix-turn-helix transcriptional regulator [Enterocloster clostridioformis]